jgi:adenosylhomocysteinase
VPGLESDGSREWASSVVREFASATNLLIAGRRFAIRGDGPRSLALGRLLVAIGARPALPGEAPDYLFLTGGAGKTHGAGATEALELRRSPLVVVETEASESDASKLTVADDALGPLIELRPGVYTTVSDDIFLVRLVGRRDPAEAGDAASARSRIDWALTFMPVSAALAAELAASGRVAGLRIGVSMVLEPKTAVLALLLRDAGAEVSVFAHPDETDDAVAAELRAAGIPVYSDSAADPAEHRALAVAFLQQRPQILVDDGSHVIRLAHVMPDVLDGMIGATEETTSGLTPLRLMQLAGALRIPVVAVNDARSKTSFDNRYGTGQSCLFTILDLLSIDAAGRTIVVAGYGHVGEGVAHHARALGAEVVVAEVDPVRSLQARFAGYRTATLVDAVRDADIVISATGVRDTISAAVLAACASDAAVAVAGGVEQEVAVDDVLAAGATRETVRTKVERVTLANGASILLLDDGGCINVTAGEGNPIEIMDLSFAAQLSAIRYLTESGAALPAGVHPLPTDLDDRVAELALEAAGEPFESAIPIVGSTADWRTARFGKEELG